MRSYPVFLNVDRPSRFTRKQLLFRVVAFALLGIVGVSLGTFYLLAYLALPIIAAFRIAFLDSSRRYFEEDGRRIMRGLHWLIALNAWAGLVTEKLPARSPEETVAVTLDDTSPSATPVSAVLRIFTGLPSALALCVLGWLGMFVWLWAAFTVLLEERVGAGPFDYLLGLQRWTLRLFAYQACLVDEYPPFSFSDGSRSLPRAGAMT
jgi:hypothetical protein